MSPKLEAKLLEVMRNGPQNLDTSNPKQLYHALKLVMEAVTLQVTELAEGVGLGAVEAKALRGILNEAAGVGILITRELMQLEADTSGPAHETF